MLETLITTKFYNPLAVGRLTERPRLDARLDESLAIGCHLMLVTAPAGFGKSTLVSAWVQKQSKRFAWLSLDRSDNDPRQFLSYLVGALQKIDSSFGVSQMNRIQTADASDRDAVYADVITHLLIEIEAMTDPFILVLDDCHLLNNPILFQLLNFLIEHQPIQMHLILLTREDLPLPVSRLRVRRQIVEIRQADLQFSTQETDDFLREGMGIDRLSANDISALEQRTEGWIAGLQLAALSLKTVSNPAQFIQSFTGSDRYILDYLLDEVFTHQPPQVQRFLLSTSILDRFCAPLCDAVLEGIQDVPFDPPDCSRAMLELAEHSSLFLIPLDTQRKWFRFHHLFADLLRHALGQANPRKIAGLHLRASQWLEANGYIQESVQHAFQTQDWLYASELVERHAWNVILHSQVGIVSDWCSAFPEAVISKRPALCIFHAWALVIAFKRDNIPAANVRLDQAESSLVEIEPQLHSNLVVNAPPVLLYTWVRGQITLLRSFILMTNPRSQANPSALIELGQLSYEQLPVEDIPARSASLLDICYASQALSDAQDAEMKFENVVRMALSGGNYFGAMVAEYHRAHGLLVQGRLQEAVAFCLQKRKDYEAFFEHPLQDMPAIALLDQAQGCTLLELNEIDQAEKLLCSGLEVGQWMPREELPGYLALARLYALKDDSQGSFDILRRLDMRWPDVRYCTQAVRILYNLNSRPDDPETRKAASTWALAHVPEIGPGIIVPGIGPAWNDEADYAVYTAWAQIQIILGKSDEALEVIQAMLAVALQHDLVHRVIELSALQASAFYTKGLKECAWEPLRLALSLAEERGYLRLLDYSPILVHLLSEALKLGIVPNTIRRILGSRHSASPANSEGANIAVSTQAVNFKHIPVGMVEPISSREIEVLALMAEGLSNSEIAARLYLSTNTLKAHTQNIYTKMDVHSRVQALNKARELKLI